jgi:hypothetical protein
VRVVSRVRCCGLSGGVVAVGLFVAALRTITCGRAALSSPRHRQQEAAAADAGFPVKTTGWSGDGDDLAPVRIGGGAIRSGASGVLAVLVALAVLLVALELVLVLMLVHMYHGTWYGSLWCK